MSYPRERFAEVLAGAACLTPASVSDPLSMRAAEALNFEVAMLAGSVAALAVLGAPDIALLSLTELTEQVRRLARGSRLPLMVDGDHGYGNALNVRRTVQELEAAGAAAVTIEDTQLPTAFGAAKPALITLEEFRGKLAAALEARRDPRFCIIGRTSAGQLESHAARIGRLTAMQAAGVDAVFFTGLKTLEELQALAAHASVPLILGARIAGATPAELAQRRVRLCLGGHQAYFDGAAATYQHMLEERTGESTLDPAHRQASRELVKRLTQADQYAVWSKRFLS